MKLRDKERGLFYVAIVALVGIIIFALAAGRDRVIAFEDENLEAVIREVINKPTDNIMKSDINRIRILDASNKEIHSLVGIESLANLEELYLRTNLIVDITPIQSLRALKKLDLRENYIKDIAPVGYLRQLTHLNLRGNLVTDIRPLGELTQMKELNLRDNQIRDINPLGKMKKLRDLNLRNNMVEDVSILLKLNSLRQRLYLEGNPIKDYRIFDRIYDQIEEKDFELRVMSPFFSHRGGFYNSPFSLKLWTKNDRDEIYYTLDGSAPDPVNNPNNTFKYEGPIQVKNRTKEPNRLSMIAEVSPAFTPPKGDVFKGTVVRAVVYNGDTSSNIATETFFVYEANKPYSLPVISIVTDYENLFDYETGIYVQGRIYDENFDPTISWERRNANYRQSGSEWERPAHMEFFESDGSLGFAQNIGIRIHGSWTTSWSQKSLRIYARSEYDAKNTINYEVFPGLTKPGTNVPLQSFKRLILRNSGNDWHFTLFRDALMQSLIKDTLVDTQAYRPTIVFINGEYWGIHNIRERYDQHYIRINYGIPVEDVVILARNSRLERGIEGDELHYLEMIEFIEKRDMRVKENYEYIKTLIDIENFIDYQISEIYFANNDWPGNNIKFWRKRTEAYEPNAPYGHDGRWRWLMYDLDFGFGLPGSGSGYRHNTLAMATAADGPNWPNPDWSTLLLRRLLENEEFKVQFINRFSDMLNSNFYVNNVINKINELEARLEPEIPEHIDRRGTGWGNMGGWVGTWKSSVQALRDFAHNRPKYVREHMTQYFNLGETKKITLNIKGEGYIKINSLTLHNLNGPWRGIYFDGIPITIEAIPKEGYRFKGWQGDLEGFDGHLILSNNAEATAIFEKK